ncbi:lipopolysaccharide biosynthesis protein [Pedobacter frigiditerrae]|uniref:Lipopolysaccharide biosynthesis protein n=1 Tax=Pedobacter frigiditerrae TaxID=2530452 RepID=A0A4R0N2A5_9SPHI|nr:lipopolysaccharide biosynthesis protein [Pedobacter frigiditerrae]TCC93959.1 lipopolysaccharide biosynthesis protein [Pedobacter frigiditerrae]
MNIKEFLNLISKYRWLIIAIPIITLIVTFFFVKNLPKEYKSQAKLSTGLLDPSRQVAPDVPSYSGPDLLIKINQQFTNIMDIMTMPKNMSILSYRLILHDLKNPKKPFKPLSNDLKALSETQRLEAIKAFEERLEKKQVLTPFDNYKVKFYNLVKSMSYDAPALSKKLGISHEQNSDFITVEFTSENTLLSVFVVNTLSHDFINNYSLDLISNKNSSILVLDSLLQKKEAIMNARIKELKDYRIQNGILNLDKQSQIVYQQIIDIENRKNLALVEKEALLAALKNVNYNLNSRYKERYLGADVSVDNQSIISLKNKVQAAENTYLDGGYNQTDKKKVDSLRQLLNDQLARANDNYVSDPMVAKQTLIQRRIAISIDLDKTGAGIEDMNRELAKLNAKFNSMVPFDAGVQNLERNADVATKEYLEILNRYNQTNLDKNIGLRLQLAEEGVPSTPEGSKKALYMALSGIASFAICFCVLFVIHALDNSINNQKQLKALTNQKIIGELNYIKPKDRDIDLIWKNVYNQKDHLLYKNLLRSLRFDINKLLATENLKIVGVTRLDPEKFGLFSVVSLAYAFASLEKKILLIGDEELAAEAEKLNITTNQRFKDILNGSIIQKRDHITFLSRELEGQSLLENKDKASIAQTFDAFKSEFDLIIIQLDAINKISDVNEWILFTDKYMATFMAGNSISDKDKDQVKSLNDDAKFAGWLINGVKQ